MSNEAQKISSYCEGCHCGCIEYPNLHPCETLVNLFREKPYQGAPPDEAKMLFVGLDANYKKEIGEKNCKFFPLIEEYHNDGVKFWKEYKVHHPFLEKYPGDKRKGGRPYHKRFSGIGFGPEHANQISFIELFHLPTFKSGELEARYLCKRHLNKINNWIIDGSNKYVFLSDGVIRRMRKNHEIFKWLNSNPSGHMKDLYKDVKRNITIYKCKHLTRMTIEERKTIRPLIDK